jgi:hypothetical protein
LAADGQTIAASDSKWYYGSPQTFANLTMDGGTLVICGDLSINNFTFNSGIIFVRPGAKLTITSGPAMLMQGNCYIYNYGKVVIQRGLVLNSTHASATQPNVFINAGASSVLEILFDYMVINNPYSWFVNEGKATLGGFVSDPQSAAGSTCLGSGSQTIMNILINNAPKTYMAPSGSACVAVKQHAYICEPVTDDATINVCMGPGGGTDSSCLVSRGKTRAWGSAQLFNSCTTCGAIAILPIQAPRVRDSQIYIADTEEARAAPVIYPNPFTSGFSIRMPDGEKVVDICLIDILGETIAHFRPGVAQDKVMVVEAPPNIPAGCYVFRIITPKKVFLQRVLKR